MTKRVMAVAVLVLTFFAAGTLTAVPAHAAVSCYASTCTGKDPGQMGCGADATNKWENTDSSGWKMELRFSRACWAAWVRFTSPSYTFTGIVEGFTTQCAPEQYPTCWGAAHESAPFGDSIHWTGRYSDMVSFTYWTRVCYQDWYGLLYEATCSPEF